MIDVNELARSNPEIAWLVIGTFILVIILWGIYYLNLFHIQERLNNWAKEGVEQK